MACERYRDTLERRGGRSFGVRRDRGARGRLRRVPPQKLGALRQALAVADAELARLLRVEPSPDLAARIRLLSPIPPRQSLAGASAGASGWRRLPPP